MRWLVGIVLAVGGVAVLLFALNRPRHHNVILITIDTLRADRLSCYHRSKNATPNIDRLAAAGTLFERTYCDVTWTTPSMSSVMTGTYATRHGMRSTYQQLDPANVTLAEELKSHGYQTAAIIGSFPLAASFGLNQGFDTYDDRFTAPIMIGGDAAAEHVEARFSNDVDAQRLYQWAKAQADAYRPDDQVSDAAISWLTDKRHEPFFLWVHYFGPHELGDLRQTPAQQEEHTVAVYDSEVRRTDAEVGRLLDTIDALGLRDHTLTILHADHGQSLGEHLYVGHGKNLYDPTLIIPLILRLPGVVPAGTRVGTIARNIDIMPTVLATVGMQPTAVLDGVSLSDAMNRFSLRGRAARLVSRALRRPPTPEPELYGETYLSATDAFAEEIPGADGRILRVGFRRLGLVRGVWKLVLNEPWPLLDYANPPLIPPEIRRDKTTVELYDLSTNSLEMRNKLVTNRPDLIETMRAAIDAYNAVPGFGGAHNELDEAAKARLRSLGYLH
jgi:arylsulfatase A-like enzyme